MKATRTNNWNDDTYAKQETERHRLAIIKKRNRKEKEL
jgi:hypothetical protein